MSGATVEEFPSEFPIKVMGRRDSELRALTQAIIERHAGPQPDSSIRTRTSGDGNFLALTYLVNATSRDQLDAIYRELTACIPQKNVPPCGRYPYAEESHGSIR